MRSLGWCPLVWSCFCMPAAAGCGQPMFMGGGNDDGGPGDDAEPDAGPQPAFSFFVTSLEIMRELSGSQDGFGGDLGGLEGADGICQEAASRVGGGGKTWVAFLSVVEGPEGGPVDAIDRVGNGPWYDANERLVATSRQGLLGERPDGDPQAVQDLPDENGVGLQSMGDTHDIMTGTNQWGTLASPGDPVGTCQDWTSAVGPGSEHRMMGGHSWPAFSGRHWIASHELRGCAPGVNLVQDGAGQGDCVGCGGGWGAFYCFAVTP